MSALSPIAGPRPRAPRTMPTTPDLPTPVTTSSQPKARSLSATKSEVSAVSNSSSGLA